MVPHIYGHYFWWCSKPIQWGQYKFFNRSCWKYWLAMRKKPLVAHATHKINSTWIIDLKVNYSAYRRKHERTFWHPGVRNLCLKENIPKSEPLKRKPWSIGWIKIKNFTIQRHYYGGENANHRLGKNSNTVKVGEFNTPSTSMGRSSKQEIKMETAALNDTLNRMGLTDSFRTFYPKQQNLHSF